MSISRIPSSDQHLPPGAVIVTIRSGSSYDTLFTERPQISPDTSRCIAVYSTDYQSLPAILSALQNPAARDCDNATLRQLVADIIAVSAESPGCVVFNFECCSDAGSHGFGCCHGATSFPQPKTGLLSSVAAAIFGSTPPAAPPAPKASTVDGHDGARGGIMRIVAHALDRGFMVIFGDFSLKALIKDWDASLLGPLPFEQV